MSVLSLSDIGAFGHIKRSDAPYGVRKEHTAHGLRRRAARRLKAHVRPYAARGMGNLSDMGDVIDDGTTWLTYGNEILGRSSAPGIGEEAGRASANIDLFLGMRSDELQAASPETVDKLVDMKMRLSALSQGKQQMESTVTAFADELGTALKQETVAGAQAVAAAPGQAYTAAKGEAQKLIDYALDKGGQVADKATIPLALIVAGVLGVAYIVYKHK